MRSVSSGFLPLLIVGTWAAGFSLAERIGRHPSPRAQMRAAALGVGFSFLVILTLALTMPQPGRSRPDAPSGRLLPHGPPSLGSSQDKR